MRSGGCGPSMVMVVLVSTPSAAAPAAFQKAGPAMPQAET